MATPPWPPDARPYAELVGKYGAFIRRTARHRGVRSADADDCAQEVLLKLYLAVVKRSLDASRPLAGWLYLTTRSVARDHLALKRTTHEMVTTTDVLDAHDDTPDRETRMNEAIDVTAVIGRVLDKLSLEQQLVFELCVIEGMPVSEVTEELKIPSRTAYKRLADAREAFAREWDAWRESGDEAVLPFALLSAGSLIAAERSIPDAPQPFDNLMRRLAEKIGPDFAGPMSGTGAAVAGADLAVAAGAGAVTLKTWQLCLGALVAGLAGAALHAALSRAPEAPVQPTAITLHERGLITATSVAVLPVIDSEAPAPPVAPAEETSSTPASTESQAKLLVNARALLGDHQPGKALALLARVTAPELAGERDTLRQLALAGQAGAATGSTGATVDDVAGSRASSP